MYLRMYLIIEYEEERNTDGPIIKELEAVNEQEVWNYIQENRNEDCKYAIYKLDNCVLDYS